MLPQFRPMSSGFTSGSVQSGQMPYSWRSPSGMAPAGGIVPAYRPGVPAAQRGAFREEVGASGDPTDAPFAAGGTEAGPAGAPGSGFFSAPTTADVAGTLGSMAAGAIGAGGLSGPVGAAVGYAAGNSAGKAMGQGIGSLAGFAVAGPIGSALFGYIGGKIGGSFDESGLADGRVGGPAWGGTIGPGPFAAPYNFETTLARPDVPVTAEYLAAPWANPDGAPWADPDATQHQNNDLDAVGPDGGGAADSGNWSGWGGGSGEGMDF